jgi:hypothetical protein
MVEFWCMGGPVGKIREGVWMVEERAVRSKFDFKVRSVKGLGFRFSNQELWLW